MMFLYEGLAHHSKEEMTSCCRYDVLVRGNTSSLQSPAPNRRSARGRLLGPGLDMGTGVTQIMTITTTITIASTITTAITTTITITTAIATTITTTITITEDRDRSNRISSGAVAEGR